MADHPVYGYSAGHCPDLQRPVDSEFLHPDARNTQRIKSRRLIAVLGEHGDCLDVRRWIDNLAYMPTDVRARQYQSRLRNEGFKGRATLG